jgi:hypothetical protein
MEAWNLPVRANPLKTREDMALSLSQLLAPLQDRFVRSGAGLHVGNTAAHYDETAALLEGECRLLWGLVPLAAGGGTSVFFSALRKGIAAGTDPAGPGYWGIGGDRDQRFVEMAAIAFAILIAPREFWDPLPEEDRLHLSAWLSTINTVELPPTNWEFFRVFVNIALMKAGMPYSPERLATGLEAIDALYRQDGWYIDETNYDLYNPFAFHFYGLLYATAMESEDGERCARFRERARLFTAQFLPWFAGDGTSLPFGRSLCYRFATASFFAALAYAGEDGLGWGVLKGLVLRDLRTWFARPIFDHEGVLTIGYAYPNLLMAEQYNAPGSPYWALKAYLPLAMPEDHPFWRSEEEPLPARPEKTLLGPPGLLITREGTGGSEHVYALNAGQYPCWESENAAAKYAKFAYSNRFGFCVSHSSYDLPKTGCDSSLLLSEGDGYWRERRRSDERRSCLDYVYSAWSPWPDVRVRTWLIPFGPWHIRIHAIESGRRLLSAEGGFSLPVENRFRGPRIPLVEASSAGIYAAVEGASGGILGLLALGQADARRAELHKPEPNLNVLHQKIFVPLLRGELGPGSAILACAVLGAPGDGGREAWADPPSAVYDPESGCVKAARGRAIVEVETGLPGLGGRL